MEAVDWQSAFNFAVGAFGVLFGWFLNVVWAANKELRDDISKVRDQHESFRLHIHETYMRRDDHHNTADAIFKKLDRIEEKIDRKADKPSGGGQ